VRSYLSVCIASAILSSYILQYTEVIAVPPPVPSGACLCALDSKGDRAFHNAGVRQHRQFSFIWIIPPPSAESVSSPGPYIAPSSIKAQQTVTAADIRQAGNSEIAADDVRARRIS